MKKLHKNICNSFGDLNKCLLQTYTKTENFLLHFWNQKPSKRIFALRKVYVKKKIPY
ncbi:hypothetical protein O3M35_005385 [Rhynocoris fuscipes]|uniref:Uncharacterized protein n=1 Tax=Rhynocoris fuscipes TaxID=488301 RepID=A0AAW1DNG0_9HEMI